jgi:hypothetical protein
MISSVQQSAGASAALGSWGTQRTSARSPLDRTAAESTALSGKSAAAETLHAGFGDGTVSVPVATIRTIGKGMEGARQVVPTLDELQQQLRAHLAEQRTSFSDKTTQSEAANVGFGSASSESVGFSAAREATAPRVQNAESTPAANQRAARAMFEIQDNEKPASYSRTGAGKRSEQSPVLNLFA